MTITLPIVWASLGPKKPADLAHFDHTIHAFEGHALTALCGASTDNPIDADLRIIESLPACERCQAELKARSPRRLFGLRGA